MNTFRNLPKNPSSGVNLEYTMNIMGAWDIALWFSSEKSVQAIDFINNKIGQISGVVDTFPVATFPHRGPLKKHEETSKSEKLETVTKNEEHEATSEAHKKRPEDTENK